MNKTIKVLLVFIGVIALVGSAVFVLVTSKNRFAQPSRAETTQYITESWGNIDPVQYKGTLQIPNTTNFKFDLSALPANTPINRALLRIKRKPNTGWSLALKVAPIIGGAEQPILDAQPPAYDSLNATEAVKQWVANPSSNGGFKNYSGSAYVISEAILEISYQGTTAEAGPSVTNLQAIHHDGQTFLTWKEVDEVVLNDQVMLDEMEKAVMDYRAIKDVRYRVYRSVSPITTTNIQNAELIQEVPAVVSSYNLQSIPRTEFPQKDSQGNVLSRTTKLIGGLRRVDYVIPRYSIEEAPLDQKVGTKKEYAELYDVMWPANMLPRHMGLAVITAKNTGSYYYAVVPQVNGKEIVSETNANSSLTSSVKESMADPLPIPQYAHLDTKNSRILKRFTYWLEDQYSHVPQTFIAGVLQPYPLPQEKKPLNLFLSHYGGGADQVTIGYYTVRNYVKGSIMLEPPSNPPESMWQGYHKNLNTLKGNDTGIVRNYPQSRAFLMLRWAKKNLPINEQRIALEGQFSAWGLRLNNEFSVIHGDAYGNFKKGIQMTGMGKSGYWGPYPEGVNNENGTNQWDFMDVSSWLINNPKVETPFFSIAPAYGTHVGDMGWAQIPEMYRALAQSKRPFAAYFGSSNGPKQPLKDLFSRIQKNQSLPAFRNGSLDDVPWSDDTRVSANGTPSDKTLGLPESGMINGYLYWEPETIIDEANLWEMTMYLPSTAPQDSATADMTPRRLQKFKVIPGVKYKWQDTQEGIVVKSGVIEPDADGLLTIPSLIITKSQNRISIAPTGDTFPSDTTPPATISDVGGTTSTPDSITFTWIAPGDDGNTGTASLYDIRYSSLPITDANWNSAKKITSILTPQSAGTLEAYTLTGLTSNKTYYLAIQTIDEWSNVSAISNIASFATQKPDIVTSPDINQDGKIDTLDFDILKQEYHRNGTIPADINQDGIVDTRDLGILMSKWNR